MEQFHHDRGPERLKAVREAGLSEAHAPRWRPFAEAARSVSDLHAQKVDFTGPVVTIGAREELGREDSGRLDKALSAFLPWKKGPYDVFGRAIDAEWRSDLKWERLLPEISPLKGRKVADIGCHNGYFLFRMAAHDPEVVVGFEPVGRHYWNFRLLNGLARDPRLMFEPFGVEYIDLYERYFDTVFCLGILYHHTDPVGILRRIRRAMRPGGQLVVECQGIGGEEPVALTPSGRYARARGVWHLPTARCLEHWVARAGFKDVRTFRAAPLSEDEQRRTDWAQVDSLADFLDPERPDRTVEGYPAPWRIYLTATSG